MEDIFKLATQLESMLQEQGKTARYITVQITFETDMSGSVTKTICDYLDEEVINLFDFDNLIDLEHSLEVFIKNN